MNARSWMAGAALALAGCATTGVESEVEIQRTGAAVVVSARGEPFTTFRIDGRVPALYPLFAPGGARATRGFPFEERPGQARDHPHHVSFWFAHGDVNGHDFWHGGDGGEVIRTVAVELDGNRVHSTHEWVAGGEVVLDERRTMTFAAEEGARSVEVELALSPRGDAIIFGDTKEGTFALRLAPTLRVEGEVAAGSLLDSEGREDGDVWGKTARWVAARGPVDGSELTVAVFDHPDNPRHPTRWHARKYGLLAANPFGRHHFDGSPPGTGDLRLDGELRLRYRVWLAAGRKGSNELEAAWSSFAARP